MRKLLILCVAAMLAASCSKDTIVNTPCNFKITVDWVKGSRAQFTISPENRNACYVYGVMPSDYKRMADHNIYVTEGMLWHHNSDDVRAYLMERLPGDMGEEGYPMKSYFDNGVNVT